jgi:hypothetical protein
VSGEIRVREYKEPNGRNTSLVRMTLIQREPAPTTRHVLGDLRGVSYYDVCYASRLQELESSDDDYITDRRRVLTGICKTGVKPMTKEEQEAERRLNWRLVKQFTMGIFKIDVRSFSFPVGYNENRTFIERSCDLFSFLVCDFLDRAAACDCPERRLSLVTIGVIASFHLYLQAKKPWNPVIGETYVGRWPNGVTIFAEQVSHHPPITCLQIRTPTNNWRIDGQFCFNIDQSLLKVDIQQNGLTRLMFSDGSRYEWEFPTIRAVGILTGDRVVHVHGPLKIKDLTHNLEAHVKVGPKASKQRGIVQPRATTIWGGVRTNGAAKDSFLMRITGDYAGTVYLDGEPVWRLERDFAHRPSVKVEEEELLPSDCRFRIDRALLIQGDADAAEEAKTLVENLQRCDAKLRLRA